MKEAKSVYDAILRKCEEQFERVKRWYERFKRINEGTAQEKSTEYYHDEVYAFFLNCYHLKDWIKNDTDVPEEVRQDVERFVGKSDALSTCGDLCNSIKHLKLNTPPRRDAEFGRRLFKVHIVEGAGSSMAVEYSIMTVRGQIDAFELATNCLHGWEQFIKTNIL